MPDATPEREGRELVPKTAEPVPLTRDLIKEIAMDVGKAVAEHIERMYPQAVAASPPSTFLLSVRNCTYNEIMAAIEDSDEEVIRARLKRRAADRKRLRAIYRKIRREHPDA